MKILVVALCLALPGCPRPPPGPVPPGPSDASSDQSAVPDAAPDVSDSGIIDAPREAAPDCATPGEDASACELACAHLCRLGCRAAAGVRGDGAPGTSLPCVEACTKLENTHYASVHPECLAKVGDCAGINRCAQTGAP